MAKEKHWSTMSESGTKLGIRLLVAIYMLLGKGGFRFLLRPVILYYWLINKQQRLASRQYLKTITSYCEQQQLSLNQNVPLTTFNHFSYFAESALNKIVAWKGDITLEHMNVHLPADIDYQSLKGTLFIGSHLGDVELARALSQQIPDLKIVALVFTKHAVRFNEILKKYQKSANNNVELIQIDQISPVTLILLQKKLSEGHTLVIIGDRTSATESESGSDHNSRVDFLGHQAAFPHGPYILAHLLSVPVYLLFALRNRELDGDFDFYLERFAEKIELPRKTRKQAILPYVQQYADRLAYYCRLSPLEWFNFYDFWQRKK